VTNCGWLRGAFGRNKRPLSDAVVRDDDKDRAKDLLRGDAHAVVDIGEDRGSHIGALPDPFRHARTAYRYCRPSRDAKVDVARHPLALTFGYHRADEAFRIAATNASCRERGTRIRDMSTQLWPLLKRAP